MAENSHPRRKSCGECAKAKRKCGLELPQCSRCLEKNLICFYANNRNPISSISIPELEFPWLDDLMREPGTLPWSGTLQSQLTTTTSVPDYLAKTEVRPPNTIPKGDADAAIQRFRTWPQKWLKEGKAPFIHCQLYASGMPKSLQDAYAACAIYSTKTPENEYVAFTIIEAKANEILRAPSQSSWTPLDLLASVQALLIFQFIRLFDGDIRQRALAESAEPVLEAWTAELQARTREEQEFTTATAPSWRSWIFSESVRRTITMSYFLSGIYCLVKYGYCSAGESITANSFTAQRRLWDARSELEWQRVKSVCNPHWVNKMQFEHVLREADSSELDDFGLVMLITYKGHEKIDDWLATASASGNFVGIPDFQESLLDVVQYSSSSVPSSTTTQ